MWEHRKKRGCKIHCGNSGTYEAEEVQLAGNIKVSESAECDYVSGFENDGDSCSFAVDIPSEGFYDPNFLSATEGVVLAEIRIQMHSRALQKIVHG